MTTSNQPSADWRSDLQNDVLNIMNDQVYFNRAMATPSSYDNHWRQQAITQNVNDTFREQQFRDACHEFYQHHNQLDFKMINDKGSLSLIDQSQVLQNGNNNDNVDLLLLLLLQKYVKQKSDCWQISRPGYENLLDLIERCNEQIPRARQTLQKLSFALSLCMLELPALSVPNIHLLPLWSLQNRARTLPITKVPRIDKVSILKYQISEFRYDKLRNINISNSILKRLTQLYEGLHNPSKPDIEYSREINCDWPDVFGKNSFRKLCSSIPIGEKTVQLFPIDRAKTGRRNDTSNNSYSPLSSRNNIALVPATGEATSNRNITSMKSDINIESSATKVKGNSNNNPDALESSMFVNALPGVRRVIDRTVKRRCEDYPLDGNRGDNDMKRIRSSTDFNFHLLSAPKPTSCSSSGDGPAKIINKPDKSFAPTVSITTTTKNDYLRRLSCAQSSSCVLKSTEKIDDKNQYTLTHYGETVRTMEASNLTHNHYSHSDQQNNISENNNSQHVATLYTENQLQQTSFHRTKPFTAAPISPFTTTSTPAFRQQSDYSATKLDRHRLPIISPNTNDESTKQFIEGDENLTEKQIYNSPVDNTRERNIPGSFFNWKFSDSNDLTNGMFSPEAAISEYVATRKLHSQKIESRFNQPSRAQEQQNQLGEVKNSSFFCELHRLQDSINEKHHFDEG